VSKSGGPFNVKPVALRIAADFLTPVSAFLRLRRGAGQACLLESVEQGQRGARYSYLGVEPFATLKVQDGRLSVREGATSTIVSGDPLRALGERLGRYRAAPAPELPPFPGGAVGYVGFGAVRYLEPVLAPAIAAPPLDVPDIFLMLFRSIVCFDHQTAQAYIIVNALLEQAADAEAQAEKEAAALLEQLRYPGPEEQALVSPLLPLPRSVQASAAAELGAERFTAAVQTIKGHIRRGDIFQCVLSERFRLPVRTDPLAIYRALRHESPTPYQFYLQDEHQVLLGASPELLVQVVGRHVETHPIAGTRPRGATAAQDAQRERELVRSAKERAEHLMLVDLGRNDLGRVCQPGSVAVRELMQVQRFSHVMHLVSAVQGRLGRGRTALDALWACFPAGTLSGAPKVRAIEILSQLEGSGRPCYGGAVVRAGFDGDLTACITIRSLLVRDGIGHAQAGAGIVADSSPQREYEEVLHKVATVRRAVARAELLGSLGSGAAAGR
jgi:anthranilate synthase component 1